MLYPPLDELCAFEVCVVLCVLLGIGSQALGELRNGGELLVSPV